MSLRPAAVAENAATLLRDSRAAARAANLHYVNPDDPGIRRQRAGKGFVYVDARGRRVRDPETLARIRSLVIPPAWKDVWICSSESGHIQATGYDARGRKQYRYHPAWRELRDVAKYQDVLPFVRALPRLRRRVDRDLKSPKLTKEHVIATIVRIMERTQIRIGNEKYAQSNGSYGLTTLRDQHARISGSTLKLEFRGKSGKRIRAELRDRHLANAVKRCRDIPGQVLFQYFDDKGEHHPVTSTDVNAYIRETMGQPFTAKEFRTWAGTLLACLHLFGSEPCSSQKASKKTLLRATESVAAQLGNTVAVCRRCYIDPVVFECYLRGELRNLLQARIVEARRHPRSGLSPAEWAVAALLEALKSPVVAKRVAKRAANKAAAQRRAA